jgi:hypothetical protein
VLARWFRGQAHRCRQLDARLYGPLLDRVADDIRAGGPCWAALAAYEPDARTRNDMPALRFMAGVHRLVLDGRAPALAAQYAAPPDEVDPEAAWESFRDAVERERDRIRAALRHPVQTNEVGRCRALVGGFLAVARETGSPLRLVELGASAGLNLRWDRYRYETKQASWGPPDSPVRFVYDYAGAHPPFGVDAPVAERLGCDVTPIDPATPAGQANLLAHVWADQHERLRLLRAALEVARRVPARIERAEASDWLARQLASPVFGVATVVFHSAVFVYLSPAARNRVRRTIADAGRRAEAGAPLAWLSLEQAKREFAVHLTTWPGGVERRLAVTDAHASRVRWLAA